MSEIQGGPAQLHAVAAAGTATAERPPEQPRTDGLTPPQPKGSGTRPIGDVIVEMGFLPQERVEPIVAQAKADGRSAEQALLESGAITGDQLSRATAQRLGLYHVDLTLFKADVGALNVIPAQMARRLGAAPIGYDEKGRLLVAMANPSNVHALDDLKLRTSREVEPVVASPDDVNGLIGRMSRLDDAVAEAVQEGEEELAQRARPTGTARNERRAHARRFVGIRFVGLEFGQRLNAATRLLLRLVDEPFQFIVLADIVQNRVQLFDIRFFAP